MVDGTCFKVHAKTNSTILHEAWKSLGDIDYDDCIKDINLIEWEDDGIFILKNYQTGDIATSSASKLNRFIKIKERKVNRREAINDYEEIIYE